VPMMIPHPEHADRSCVLLHVLSLLVVDAGGFFLPLMEPGALFLG